MKIRYTGCEVAWRQVLFGVHYFPPADYGRAYVHLFFWPLSVEFIVDLEWDEREKYR